MLKTFVQRANRLRKRKWSAPAVMSAFILICMIVVFSFESIGILNKEKNLEYRHNIEINGKI
jgi:hypothetical protein